jgi:light-regulated signal transduction histidine kinase (bacteriophytochrome)
MGQDLTKLMPEEYRKAHTEGLSRYLKTGKARVLGKRLELQGQRKCGEIFPLEISITKTDTPDGQYFTGALRDISERKKVEEQIERANKELKDFAYIVSHDLKAPLRGITSLATWIKQDYSNKLDDDGNENIDLIISRVQRMSNLIEGILRYSKIGRIEEQISRINTNDLVINIIDSINPPNNIKISIDGKLPEIYCEEVTLEQVFQNLINNAIKFMDKPDGRIVISCEENEQFWLFKVEDNGPGIEKKHQDKIFHIFQTLNARDEIESTGIGLTIVKKIIENYKGKIWFDSEIGKGTVFCFTIPKTLGDNIL